MTKHIIYMLLTKIKKQYISSTPVKLDYKMVYIDFEYCKNGISHYIYKNTNKIMALSDSWQCLC